MILNQSPVSSLTQVGLRPGLERRPLKAGNEAYESTRALYLVRCRRVGLQVSLDSGVL